VYAGTTTDSSYTYNGRNSVFFRNNVASNADPYMCTTCAGETYRWVDASNHFVGEVIAIFEGQLTNGYNVAWFTSAMPCDSSRGYPLYITNDLTHEFGHFIGMAHNMTDTEATMWPSVYACETVRQSLDPDDIAGAQAMYPPGGPAPTPVPAPVPVTVIDTTPPTAPSSLTAALATIASGKGKRVTTKTVVKLAWSASADNVGVAQYQVFRNGALLTSTTALGYQDSSTVSGGGTYSYSVIALDAAGNASSPSNAAVVTR
jgi:hypothetical protein